MIIQTAAKDAGAIAAHRAVSQCECALEIVQAPAAIGDICVDGAAIQTEHASVVENATAQDAVTFPDGAVRQT